MENDARTEYHDYFRDVCGASLSEKDVRLFRKSFYSRWRNLIKRVAITPGSRVLEIGSGFGGLHSFLAEVPSITYVGIEPDAVAANFANDHFHTDCFLNETLENLQTEVSFDFVLAFEVIEHLKDPANAFRKVATLLEDGGIFAGTSPYPFQWNVLGDRTHVFVLHPLNWKKLLLASGFNTADCYAMSFLPVLWRLDGRLSPRIPFYVPVKHFVSTCMFVAQKG
jgi:SAM-dependent methyltransferase